MNPIAAAALKRARDRQAGRREQVSEEAAAETLRAAATLAAEVFAAGEFQGSAAGVGQRVDLVLRIEGRREALGMVERARGMIRKRADLEGLHAQLQRAALGRPHSYAVGVLEVAGLIEHLLEKARRPEGMRAPRNSGNENVARHEEVLDEQRTDS
ncbi:hypothetical protein TUM18999_57820 [Pseudomonas tohonis]|uniref:Uncharacterized protein n=1 Tax=Pseudomonas tohonis TaxID=2725477 RepID=A0A6J4EGL7_9PSED|nr:hypothetical protein [Pseudomonas tohonis]BCG27591.1 hypothetical protein TUM18999_57820 [Pseudomonas tohonis]